MKKLLFLLGLIAAALLAYYCVSGDSKKIQSDISSRLAGKMNNAGLPDGISYAVDGRDVVLTGFVGDQETKSEIGKTALSLYGVRVVDNQIKVKEAVVAVIEEPKPMPVPEPIFAPEPEPVFTMPEPLPETTFVETVEIAPEPEVVLEVISEPEPVIDACQNDLAAIMETEKINFDSGRDTIKSGSYGLLNRLAVAAKKCEEAVISIHGYTDSSGDMEANRQLSLRRAKSVGRYFITKGVAQEIRVVGNGPNDPVADNETPEGRAQNRRIEFRVYKTN